MQKVRQFLLLLLVTISVVMLSPAILRAASIRCDFNGDGYDDIAVNVPGDPTVNGLRGHYGAVNVIYGRASGLRATNNQLWSRASAGVPGEPSLDDGFQATTCGDFNGDGIGDLVFSAAKTPAGDKYGSITILFGTKRWGVSTAGAQVWTQDSPGILDQGETGDNFGFPTVAGDFNGDGHQDLAIGVSGEDIGTVNDAGAVEILYGTSNGLSSAGNQFWTEDNPQTNELFGSALTGADFGKDNSSQCYDDLAVGIRRAVVNGFSSGAVHVIYGSASGLSASGNQFWTLDSPGIPGIAANLDSFGEVVAAGNFRGLTAVCGTKVISDLAISGPIRIVGGKSRAGTVWVIYGTDSGLSSTNAQLWTQDSPGIAEEVETSDVFGRAIVTGKRNTGGDYLAIGAAGESGPGGATSGVVHVLFPDPSTGLLTASGSKLYHQNTPGIKDIAEPDDHFGFSLGTGDFNADGDDDLVVGVPNENLPNDILTKVTDVGAINVLYSAGTSFTQFFHQNSIDIKGTEESNDQFGYSLVP